MSERANADDAERMRAELEAFLNEHLNDLRYGWPRRQEVAGKAPRERRETPRCAARQLVVLRAGLFYWPGAARLPGRHFFGRITPVSKNMKKSA